MHLQMVDDAAVSENHRTDCPGQRTSATLLPLAWHELALEKLELVASVIAASLTYPAC
jgi:hypothetical protein